MGSPSLKTLVINSIEHVGESGFDKLAAVIRRTCGADDDHTVVQEIRRLSQLSYVNRREWARSSQAIEAYKNGNWRGSQNLFCNQIISTLEKLSDENSFPALNLIIQQLGIGVPLLLVREKSWRIYDRRGNLISDQLLKIMYAIFTPDESEDFHVIYENGKLEYFPKSSACIRFE